MQSNWELTTLIGNCGFSSFWDGPLEGPRLPQPSSPHPHHEPLKSSLLIQPPPTLGYRDLPYQQRAPSATVGTKAYNREGRPMFAQEETDLLIIWVRVQGLVVFIILIRDGALAWSSPCPGRGGRRLQGTLLPPLSASVLEPHLGRSWWDAGGQGWPVQNVQGANFSSRQDWYLVKVFLFIWLIFAFGQTFYFLIYFIKFISHSLSLKWDLGQLIAYKIQLIKQYKNTIIKRLKYKTTIYSY